LICLSTIPAFAWDGFPLRYNMDTNIVSWAQMEAELNVSSQLWYAARERYVAGNTDQDGAKGWSETHTYLYEIATSNVVYTDGATWTNSTTNTWMVYSNNVIFYGLDGGGENDLYAIGDDELGSYEITNAVWTNSLIIHPSVKYQEMIGAAFSSIMEPIGDDDEPVEFYVEWHLSTNDDVTLDQYFARPGVVDTNGTVEYPPIPFQTVDGVWARHKMNYRTNNVVTTNVWGLITDTGTGGPDYLPVVTKIPTPLKLAESRWIPDLYLDGYPEFGGVYEGEYVWDEDDQGWNRAAAFFRIVGFYTNGVWKYVGLETGAGAHVFVGDQLGASNTWVATDAYTNIAGDTASMIVSYTNTGVWQFHEIQPLFDATEGFLRPYTGTPEIVYSGSTNLSPVVTVQGSTLTNWNNNPFGLDTSAEDTATVTGGTNRYTLSGEETWQRITNILVDTDGLAGESISVTYYAPTNYYLWSLAGESYAGDKASTDYLDWMFRWLNALQWTGINYEGDLTSTSNVSTNTGTWTWDGYGWDDAEDNVVTNSTDPGAIGALAVTSPDPNWTIVDTPTDLVDTNLFNIRFTSPTNDYRMDWGFQFRAEIAGTITLSNSHASASRTSSWQVDFGSDSDTGGGSIGPESAVEYTFTTLTNVFTGTSGDTNQLWSCGIISKSESGTDIVFVTSDITYTLAEFRFPRVWARRWSASALPDVTLNQAWQKEYTNILAAVTTDRELYLESDTPVNPFAMSTNFVYDPEVDDLRYDETNMVGMFTLVDTWTGTSTDPTNHIYTDGEIGEVIPYGANVDWDQGWRIKFENNVIKGLYLIKWDVDGGFRHGRTNVYDYPLQESE
jgi:hypothetical protein